MSGSIALRYSITLACPQLSTTVFSVCMAVFRPPWTHSTRFCVVDPNTHIRSNAHILQRFWSDPNNWSKTRSAPWWRNVWSSLVGPWRYIMRSIRDHFLRANITILFVGCFLRRRNWWLGTQSTRCWLSFRRRCGGEGAQKKKKNPTQLPFFSIIFVLCCCYSSTIKTAFSSSLEPISLWWRGTNRCSMMLWWQCGLHQITATGGSPMIEPPK
jgi:hypothetical protein